MILDGFAGVALPPFVVEAASFDRHARRVFSSKSISKEEIRNPRRNNF